MGSLSFLQGILPTQGLNPGLPHYTQPASDQTRSDADATGGARAWIAGTDGFREGSLEFRFLLQRGEFHAYLPFAADDDWIRVEITDTGHATVRRCDPGVGTERIAGESVASVSDFRSTHSLLLTVRDGLLFVRLRHADRTLQ